MPLPNICTLKQQEEASYLEEPTTGAKVSMRDAKQLVEFFCMAYADIKIKLQKIMNSDERAQLDESANKHHELKPNYISDELAKDGVKFYYSVLYMPETCKHILRKVNPKNAFVKKKDAENHVALIAIRKLRQLNHLDEHLFPKIPGDSSVHVQHMW